MDKRAARFFIDIDNSSQELKDLFDSLEDDLYKANRRIEELEDELADALAERD